MKYTVNQLYQHLYERPLNIYEIFKGFFGEDFVDIQTYLGRELSSFKEYLFAKICDESSITNGDKEEDFNLHFEVSAEQLVELEDIAKDRRFIIYVWWPRVTVTNEYGKSVNIQDLYAKIEIQGDGTIPYECNGFRLNRATYTREQFMSNYMHSHINVIPKNNFTDFQIPCLGTGPIISTIGTLKNDYDEVTWMLFCQELSMYVTVESISGGPYRRMENIGNVSLHTMYTGYNFNYASKTDFLCQFTNDDLKKFIQYYLKHGHLSLGYINNVFTWSMPYYEYIIDISNSFIDFYNKYYSTTAQNLSNCFNTSLLKQVIVADGKFYNEGEYNSFDINNLSGYQNKLVLVFKGKEIRTTIINNEQSSESTLTTVINNNVAMFILQKILRTINFRYKNEHNNKNRRDQEVTTAYERVIYL
jgi:hypothetical protein